MQTKMNKHMKILSGVYVVCIESKESLKIFSLILPDKVLLSSTSIPHIATLSEFTIQQHFAKNKSIENNPFTPLLIKNRYLINKKS